MIARESVIRRWLAAGDAGNFDAFDDLLHRDVVVHAPGGLSTTSRDDEKSVWRAALAAVPGLRHSIQEVVIDGDVEMARVVVSGVIMRDFAGVVGSGRAFSIDQAVVVHLRQGEVVEAWEIADLGAIAGQTSPSDQQAL